MKNQELINNTNQVLDKLIKTGAKSWTLHVPPQPTDPDLLISDLSARFQKSLVLLEKAKANFEIVAKHSDYDEEQFTKDINDFLKLDN